MPPLNATTATDPADEQDLENDDLSSARGDAEDIFDDEFAGLTDGDALAEDPPPNDRVAVREGDATLEDEPPPTVERQRDPSTGQFTTAPTVPKAGETSPAKPAAGSTATPTTAAAPATATVADAPQWKPLAVTVDKAIVPISNAAVSDFKGHKIVSIKEEHWPAFQSQLTKGVVAERLWRDLHAKVQEFETQRAMERDAPHPKSDAEIEAEVILEYMRPKLAELFDDPREREWLADKVARKQLEHKGEFAKTYGDWRTKREGEEAERQSAAQEGETQLAGLAQVMHEITNAFPQEFGEIPPAVLKEIADDLISVRRAAYWREADGQWYADTALIYNRMKAVVARHGSTTATPGTPGTTATAPAGTTTSSTTTDRDTRFNNAQRPTPQTTSVRDRRTADPRNTGTTGNGARRPKGPPAGSREAVAIAAEERYGKAKRAFMKSDGLDFELDGDET